MPNKTDNKLKFAQGEKVLCYHGPLLYEAKCVDIDQATEPYKYFVHYQGWNKTWDEWITDDRMIKFNENGLKKQKELQEELREARKKKKKNDKKKTKKVGSTSDASNRSIPEESEDGRDSKTAVGDEDTRTDAGTSVLSEDISGIMDDIPNPRPTKASRKKAANNRKRKLSTEQSEDGGTVASDKFEDDDNRSIATASTGQVDEPGSIVTAKTEPIQSTNTSKSTNTGRSRKSVLVPLDENIADLDVYGNSVNSSDTLQCTLSEKLRFWLVDDWDLVTRQSRLTSLPSKITVNDLLGKYRQFVDSEAQLGTSENSNKLREMRMELIDGLKKYFNVALGSMLLYKFERLQYLDLINRYSTQKSELSGLYGPVHMLRLLVNIQKLIAYTRSDKVSLACLSDLLQHFVDFLDKNSEELLKLDDYITATADYTRRAMC